MSRRKKEKSFTDTDTVIDLDAQRETRRRQLREAAAESRRRRGVPDREYEYDYYGYRTDGAAPESGGEISEPAEGESKSAAGSRKKREKKKKSTPVKLAILIVAVVVIICVLCSVWNILSLKLEEGRAKDKIAELEEEKAELQKEVDKIGTEEYIEEQARTWLKMAKSGEIIYIFDEEGSGEGAEETS